MQRRTFLRSSVAGVLTGSLATQLEAAAAPLQPATDEQAERALGALRAAKRVEARGAFAELRSTYHSDAVLMEPSLAKPAVGRAAIADGLRALAPERTLLYFYYRQPQVVQAGNAALVVSNYEAGYRVGDKVVEDSGKTSNVVLLGPEPPLIAQEVVVPNIYAGSYGSLGTALARPRYARFPLRALGQPPFQAPDSAGGGESDVLFSLVRRINGAWVDGRPEEILRVSNPTGAFLIGDYSAFYITGTEAFREHFDDFYSTGRVMSIHEVNPVVRIWGPMAAVAFDFDLDYAINNQQRRAPGRAVYTFVRSGQAAGAAVRPLGRRPAGAERADIRLNTTTVSEPWSMGACAASHLVGPTIGDPYVIPE